MHRNRIGFNGALPPFRSFIGELQRRKPQHPLAHRTHPVGKAAGVAVRVGLGAFVVDFPIAALHITRQRRRMQRPEIGVTEKIDGQRQRIADLDVVGVEKRPGAEIAASHARKLDDRRQNQRQKNHRAPLTL